jgi:hypothetical protein
MPEHNTNKKTVVASPQNVSSPAGGQRSAGSAAASSPAAAAGIGSFIPADADGVVSVSLVKA